MRYIIFFLFFNWITDSSPQLTKSELILNETHDEVIKQSLEFLINRQKRDGSWVYDYQPFTGKITHKGSIVRQAGTLFAAALAYDGKDSRVKKMINSAMDYFQINSTPFDRKNFKLRILSESKDGFTGTSALFLCAFFYLHHQWPDQFPVNQSIYKELMDTMEYYALRGGGISRSMKSEETYIEAIGRPAEPYASAQHFLVLALYHFVFKRKHITPTLKTYIKFYDRNWTYSDLVPSYHWVMQAYWILALLDNPDLERELPRMVANLKKAAEREIPIVKINNNYCAQVEGYAAYLRYKWEQKELDRRELYKLSYHLRHLKKFQLRSGISRKIVKDNVETKLPIKEEVYNIGGFWHKQNGIYHTRIDLTQHCMAAFVHHKSLIEGIQEKESWNQWIDHSDRWKKVPPDSEETPIPKLMHPVQLKEVITEIPVPVYSNFQASGIHLPHVNK